MIVHVVFDGPPGPVAGRFIEVETPDGKGLSVGRWIERDDGYWALEIDVIPKEPARGDTERPDDDKLKIALMERDWLLGAWAAMAGIPQAEAEAEMLVWTKKWRETAVRDTDQGHEPKIAPKTCACGHPLEAHMVFRTGPPHPCSECKCTTYTEQEPKR